MPNDNEHTRWADDHQAHSHFTGPCQRSPESLQAYGGVAGKELDEKPYRETLLVLRDLKAVAYIGKVVFLTDPAGILMGWRLAV